jgi:hypothetical protein
MKRHLEEHPRGMRVPSRLPQSRAEHAGFVVYAGWVAAGRLSISPRRPECQTSPRLSRFSKLTTPRPASPIRWAGARLIEADWTRHPLRRNEVELRGREIRPEVDRWEGKPNNLRH